MKRCVCGFMLAAMMGGGVAREQMVQASAPVPPAPAQAADPLLAGTEQFAKGAKEANEINMDGKTLGMLSDKREGSDLPKKMDFVVVRNYTYEKAGMYGDAGTAHTAFAAEEAVGTGSSVDCNRRREQCRSGFCSHGVTRVPRGSPATTRVMFPCSRMEKTIMGM